MIVNYQYNSIHFDQERCNEEAADAMVLNDSNLKACFESLVAGNNVVVKCSAGYMRRLLKYVYENYIFVKAAGGIVRNAEGKLLLMTRNGRADLPKGKVEEGETLAQAALRETEEETGLSSLSLGRMLHKTYHIYNLYGGWHFKQTTWYEMTLLDDQTLVPQQEENITDLEWLDAETWRRRLEGSYSTMKELSTFALDNQVDKSKHATKS